MCAAGFAAAHDRRTFQFTNALIYVRQLDRINGPHRGAWALLFQFLPNNKSKYLSDGIHPQLDQGEDKIRLKGDGAEGGSIPLSLRYTGEIFLILIFLRMPVHKIFSTLYTYQIQGTES
jgi:hypothetical protein